MNAFFKIISRELTSVGDPFLCVSETSRFQKEFPAFPDPPVFLYGDGNVTYLSVLDRTLRRHGVEAEHLDHIHVSALSPAFPICFSLDIRAGHRLSVIVGPSQDGAYAKEFFLIPEAVSRVSRAVWDQYVWDHEIAHFMLGKACPPRLSRANYAECVSDSYALLRAFQRGAEAQNLAEDIQAERSLFCLSDYEHDTVAALEQTILLGNGAPERIKEASPQALFDMARAIAEDGADTMFSHALYRRALEGCQISDQRPTWHAVIESHRFCQSDLSDEALLMKKQRFLKGVSTIAARIGKAHADSAESIVSFLCPPLDIEGAAKTLKTYVETYAAFHEPESRAQKRQKIEQAAQDMLKRRQNLKAPGTQLLFHMLGGGDPEAKIERDERALLSGLSEKMTRDFPGLFERLEPELKDLNKAMALLEPDRQKVFLQEAWEDFQYRAIAQAKLPLDEQRFAFLARPAGLNARLGGLSQR